MIDDASQAESAAAAQSERRPFIFRVYDWYDRYDTWRERADWLLALLKANAAASTAAVTTTTAAVTVGTVAIVNPQYIDRVFGRAEPETVQVQVQAPPPAPAPVYQEPVEVASEPLANQPPIVKAAVRVKTNKWGEATVYPIEGEDAEGRKARFEVAVLPKEINWQRKNSDNLSRGEVILTGDDIAREILVDEFRTGLSQSGAVMAVGVASQEGRVSEESERARQRAETAAQWLTGALPEQAGIWTLNLGQYKGSCAVGETDDTAWQRPVLMIGIREQEDGVDLGQALGNAMAGKSNLPDRTCYSHFDLKRHR